VNSLLRGLIFLLLSQGVLALDESRLWLPKKHQDLMPKFISAALATEKTERCLKIVNGEFAPEKSDDEFYHFNFTCRDIKRRTYNISYRYPVKGGEAMVDEQKVVRPEDTPTVKPVDMNSLEGEKNSDASDVAPVDPVVDDWGDWGDWDSISNNKKVELLEDDFEQELDDEDAWGDWGDWDSIISTANEEEDQELSEEDVPESEATDEDDWGDWGDWGDWEAVVSGKPQIVDEEGSAIQLTADHAWTICKEKIADRTRLMLDVTLHGELKKSKDSDKKGNFYFEVPFEAKNPRGDALRYIAACTVSVYDGVTLKLKARAK
jgi:hypothetical protein